MKKRNIIMTVAIAFIFAAALVYAGTTAPDVIDMNSPAYAKHKKAIVQFSHKKHAEEYGVSCGECHHDDSGQALELKAGDEVQKCIECHDKAGTKPRRKADGPKLSREEEYKQKLEYHAEALHINCKDCHKSFNKKNAGGQKAPVTCSQCHKK